MLAKVADYKHLQQTKLTVSSLGTITWPSALLSERLTKYSSNHLPNSKPIKPPLSITVKSKTI